jgi:hypothetical protein
MRDKITEDQAVEIWARDCPEEGRYKEEFCAALEDGRHVDWVWEQYGYEVEGCDEKA